ncbi:MAG: phosphoribosyltransferase [Anaerolineae bacterium]|nr:phosphoribosyltransferase [Anaerolineae bacterium]NIN99405.1 phosphoribosyltransferase [Anaerolineae bacterium]NIQ82270.1 phosphoribosyltransferase [Anaerolineae bacterium]
MLFKDRREAGKALAQELAPFKGQDDVIVLGIPRGGVVVGHEVAEALDLPLDVYITRKIGAPRNPELAIGAVASDGTLILDHELANRLGVPQDYIDRESERQTQEIKRRTSEYRGERPDLELKGKVVILADDGVATGATTLATIKAIRAQDPAKLVLAVPVGPRDTIERLKREVDELYCLHAPEIFWAVGAFYNVFDQTSDEEVKTLLQSDQQQPE